jgi:hypothetical protein
MSEGFLIRLECVWDAIVRGQKVWLNKVEILQTREVSAYGDKMSVSKGYSLNFDNQILDERELVLFFRGFLIDSLNYVNQSKIYLKVVSLEVCTEISISLR